LFLPGLYSKSISKESWTGPSRFSEAPKIFRQSAHEGVKVVSTMHFAAFTQLLPGDITGTHFCYRLSRPLATIAFNIEVLG